MQQKKDTSAASIGSPLNVQPLSSFEADLKENVQQKLCSKLRKFKDRSLPQSTTEFSSMFMNDCMWAVIFLRKKEEEYKNILVNHQVNHCPDHYGNSACQTSRSSTCRTTSLGIQFETRFDFEKMEAYVFTGATNRRISVKRCARIL